jgi:hypothetical protein
MNDIIQSRSMIDVEIKARSRQFSVRELLDCRQATHGNFADNAHIAQALKLVFRSAPNWSALTDVQREALEMLSGKLARFLSGDSSHADHIDDAIGYLTLIARGDA